MATAFMKRVLTAIRECPDANATEFAEKLWPESPKHRYHKRTGHGVTTGTRLNLVAAVARKRAIREGYAIETFDVKGRRWRYSLTAEGMKVLRG